MTEFLKFLDTLCEDNIGTFDTMEKKISGA